MFGNLINNRQIKGLINAKTIEIEPFSAKDLSTVHYTLHINKVMEKMDNGKWQTVYDFTESDNPYSLKPNEYVKVVILEKIKLNDENIVGHFIPSSNLIEEGLLLIAGKIDKKFGNTGPKKGTTSEMINFGLKNLTTNDILIKPNHRIAHLELYDLRGVSSEKTNMTKEEELLRLIRTKMVEDGGVFYGDGSI